MAGQWETALATTHPVDGIAPTADGGVFMVGFLDGGWLAKLDATGSVAWQKTYGSADRTFSVYAVQATPDLGCVVAGDSVSMQGDSVEGWIAKVDANGSDVWQKTLDVGVAAQVALSKDGGYVAVGSGAAGVYATKLDANGMVQWAQTYSVYPDTVTPNDIRTTSDGGYVMTGTYGPAVSDHPAWVIKIDSNGAVQWQKRYGGGGGSILPLSDGGYVMGGAQLAADGSWVLKLDAMGAVTWQQKFFANDADAGAVEYRVSAVRANHDGGYAVAGMVGGWPAAQDSAAFFARLDANGSLLEGRYYGGSDASMMMYAIEPTADCGYVVGGAIADKGAWLAKIDTHGDLPSCSLVHQGSLPVLAQTTAALDAAFTSQPITVAASDGTAATSAATAAASAGCP